MDKRYKYLGILEAVGIINGDVKENIVEYETWIIELSK